MISGDRRRHALVLALVLTGLWLTWVMVATFVVPIIIGQAYRAESLPLFNRLISGQESRALDVYLSLWRRLAAWSSIALLGFAVAVFVGDYYRRALRERVAMLGGAAAAWMRGYRVSMDELRQFGLFVAIAGQVAVLVLVIQGFHVENPVFYTRLAPLILFGFLVHSLLPQRARQPFFVTLSVTAIYIVFGLVSGTWLIGIGVALIAVCHLPIAFFLRVAILLALSAALALGRGQIVHVPWPAALWPILASMFMFRLIVYLYDIRHQTEAPTPWQSLSYFFLLPNVVFPLFPVVDFSTFRRTYYDEDANRIYQRGVQWMLLGLTHLLVYRFIYHRVVIAPTAVDSLPKLVFYAITTFLLYFRVAGQFHLIIGILHLFGFHLPKTYNNFLLASSFMDLWRRNNIYWKDFMMKVFYYPMYFRVKKLGNTKALVVSMVVVVVVTWALHAVQWFWILGASSISGPDTAFWVLLGIGMVTSLLLENRRKKPRLRGKQWSVRASAVLAGKTVGFFVTFTLLWSLFMSPSLGHWFSLVGGAQVTLDGVLLIGVGFALALGVFVFTHWMVNRVASRGWKWSPGRAAPVTAFAILVLLGLVDPRISSGFPLGTRALVADLRLTELNALDAARLQQGYYENLTGVSRFNGQLWEVYAQRPQDWPIFEEIEATRITGDFRGIVLRPLAAMYYKGARFRTNRWGMRDQDYEQTPPPNTHRIALLGASYVMGSGVNDGEAFEAVLERRLNEDAARTTSPAIEILNFAVGGYTQVQQLAILEDRVFSFKPNHLFVIGHHRDGELLAIHLIKALQDGVEIPFDFMRQILDDAGITKATPGEMRERLLIPYRRELLLGVHRAIVQQSMQRGITPVWIYLVPPGAVPSLDIVEDAKAMAEEAGYVVVGLSHVYDGYEPTTLYVAPWDRHPNAEGHALIAKGLYDALHRDRAALKLPIAPMAPDGDPSLN